LYLLVVLSLFCFTQQQQVFTTVKNLLTNLHNDIVREENESTARCASEARWISGVINRSIAKLARRTRDVKRVQKRIRTLESKIDATSKSIKQKKARIVSNRALLKKFKHERCENNFFFIKELASIQTALSVFKQIRIVTIQFFKSNSGRRRALALVEKFTEFANLFDDQHKVVLAELTNKLRQLPDSGKLHGDVVRAEHRARSDKEIGSGHIDNNRGELKRLRTPGYENIHDFTTNLERRLIKLIDSLIQHLKNTQRALTAAEIKASRDFAKFHNEMKRENRHLRRSIKRLTKRRVLLRTRLARAKVQLARRELLRKEAQVQLALRRKIKAEKDTYCRNEHNRRAVELANIRDASNIFRQVLDAVSKRVNIRAHEVVDAESSTEKGLHGRKSSRHAVAY